MTGALFYCSSGANPWYWTQKCRVSAHRSVVSDCLRPGDYVFAFKHDYSEFYGYIITESVEVIKSLEIRKTLLGLWG